VKTIIIGLGNPILTDDGVGVKAAYRLQEHPKLAGRSDLEITEASVGGLRLMELMIGYQRAIIIDAFIDENDNRPGRITRMTMDDLRRISPTQHSASAHDTSLVTAFDMGLKMGLELPTDVVIYAIEVENVLDFSEKSTPAVAAAIPTAVQAVLAEIDRPNGSTPKHNNRT
jgi:hydrogenase maturation protease